MQLRFIREDSMTSPTLQHEMEMGNQCSSQVIIYSEKDDVNPVHFTWGHHLFFVRMLIDKGCSLPFLEL
eukprot:2196664-Amphidinium_carterae.1